MEKYDLQNFIQLREINEMTRLNEQAGMPKGYLVFANDCMGNLFVLKKTELSKPQQDVPIYVFDHDYCEIKKISHSFLEFLDWLMGLKNNLRTKNAEI